MNREGLSRLGRIAGLLRELRLAELQQAEAARHRSEAQIAALTRPEDPQADLAAVRVRLLYDVWAEKRRQELVGVLAEQTRLRDRARAAAGAALGRDRVIGQLAERAGGPKRY